MRESIETWKVLILILETFCFGGSIGFGMNARNVLTVLSCVFGIIYIAVI